MIYLLYTIHVLVCIFLILVVLLQQGKGADLSVFGGGATMTAFGARGAATLLHKLTVISFILFILTTLAIGITQGGRSTSSVMSGVTTESGDAGGTTADSSNATPAPTAPEASSSETPSPEQANPGTGQ